jgi:hypothetical protein
MVVDAKVSIDRDTLRAGGSLRFIQRIDAEYGKGEDGTEVGCLAPKIAWFRSLQLA